MTRSGSSEREGRHRPTGGVSRPEVFPARSGNHTERISTMVPEAESRRLAHRRQDNDEKREQSGRTGSGSSETDIVKNGVWLRGSITARMGFIPPELLGWHWAVGRKTGELPDHEWARADLLRPNDLHGPGCVTELPIGAWRHHFVWVIV